LTPETQYIVNERSISLMKPGVMLINTGRGKLIESRALIEALKSGKISAAGLDVYEEESEYFFEDLSNRVLTDDVLARLLTFNNVIVTSHQGFFTREALSNIALTTLSNIREFEQNTKLSNEISVLDN
ncbi:MAG: 2-hydroxyacid dehydrogenase, partial [Bacteroidetes bacterium]|nr:2-hydroxyacid dehydrogenase [Bacteroidota bacterium]